jgi:hypothetical protein
MLMFRHMKNKEDIHFAPLVAALEISSFTSFSLADNRMENTGALLLAELLPKCNRISHIDLSKKDRTARERSLQTAKLGNPRGVQLNIATNDFTKDVFEGTGCVNFRI